MKTTSDEEEARIEEWAARYRQIGRDPVRRALLGSVIRITSNPEYHAWTVIGTEYEYGLRPEYRREVEQLSRCVTVYVRFHYPDVFLDLYENPDWRSELERLRKDPVYTRLMQGIAYFGGELEDPQALPEIVSLLRQLRTLIEAHYPLLARDLDKQQVMRRPLPG